MIKLIVFNLEDVLIDIEDGYRDSLLISTKDIIGSVHPKLEDALINYKGLFTEKIKLIQATMNLSDTQSLLICDRFGYNIARDLYRGIKSCANIQGVLSSMKNISQLSLISNSPRTLAICETNILAITSYFPTIITEEDITSSIYADMIKSKMLEEHETLIVYAHDFQKYDSPCGANYLKVNNISEVTPESLKTYISTL